MKYLLAGIIRVYRFFSKYTPPCCRYSPTCSQYAYTAIMRHGAAYGTFLAIRRILRCNPWAEGGDDPVPPRIVYPLRRRTLGTNRKVR